MSLVALDRRLLDHLVVEFGLHGRRAVEFLTTAAELLELDPSPTARKRLPETIAYCLREAMKAIPASQEDGGGGYWRAASRAVAEARTRYAMSRGVPGEDEEAALNALFASIDDLELVHSQEGIHERRMIAIMVSRTGVRPVTIGTEPIRVYQDLLKDLDSALHGDTTFDDARRLWNRCGAILQQLFLPPDVRNAELDSLAAIEVPTTDDVARLSPLIAGPHHLRFFLSRIVSTSWLEALTDTGILDPSEGGMWPAFAAVDRLAGEHPLRLAEWLQAMYRRHATEPGRAWFVARAAADVGADAAPVVLQALRDHGTTPAIASVGVWAVEKLDASDQLVEQFADLLLNEAQWVAADYVEPVIERLVDGLDQSNVQRRLQLVCWKLRRTSRRGEARLAYDRGGSIAEWAAERDDDRFAMLLRTLVEILRRAIQWMRLEEILGTLDSLAGDIGGRLRAWALSLDPSIDVTRLIDEIAQAIRVREPTGDDLPLLDHITREAGPLDYVAPWTEALGAAPSVSEVSQRLADHNLPPDWLRAISWAGVLPDGAAGAWARPASVVAGVYGPSRERLAHRPRTEASFGRSPISADDLAPLSVVEATARIATWRPDPADWLAGARELARTMEEVINNNGDAWLESPLRVATSLRHPTYIHHYVRAITELIRNGASAPSDELIDVIGFVRAQPWEAEPLGRSSYDYDADWGGAEQAGVDLLKALADKDQGFGGRDDEVWDVIDAAVRDRGEESTIISGARDPLESAINRPCTKALDCALSFMAYEFRKTGRVRTEACELLEHSLHLEGEDGAQHRAILATRLGFLRHAAPEWFDQRVTLIVGVDAPDGLAQTTADLAIKWALPNAWLLENCRTYVRDAASRDVNHALEHLLVAMLWGIPGYSVRENVSFLRQWPTRLSQAGESIARLLRHDDANPHHIALAVTFWTAAIATGERDGLVGFGWLAEVDALDDDTWTRLTLETASLTGGRLDWSHKVAQRAISVEPSTTILAIMNLLVRGTSKEWDRRRSIECAVKLLQAAQGLDTTPEYERLRTTLLERGAL